MNKENIFWILGISFILLLLLFIAIPFFLYYLYPDNHFYYEMLPWVMTTVFVFLLSLLGAFTLLHYQSETHRFEIEKRNLEAGIKTREEETLKERIKNASEIREQLKKFDGYNETAKSLTLEIKELKTTKMDLSMHQIMELEDLMDKYNTSFEDLKKKFIGL